MQASDHAHVVFAFAEKSRVFEIFLGIAAGNLWRPVITTNKNNKTMLDAVQCTIIVAAERRLSILQHMTI